MKNRTMKYRSLRERYQILLEAEATDPKPAPAPEPEVDSETSAQKKKDLENFKNGLKSAFDDFDSTNSENIANIITNLTVKELKEFLEIVESNDGDGEGEKESIKEEVKKVEDILGGMNNEEKESSGLNKNFNKLIDFLRKEGIIA